MNQPPRILSYTANKSLDECLLGRNSILFVYYQSTIALDDVDLDR